MTAPVGEVERALLEAARLERDDDVLVLGAGALVFAVQTQVGEGWVYAVQPQVDELEELLGEARSAGAAGIAYLVGEAAVLPLPDASVVAAIGRLALEDGTPGGAVAELARVVKEGGRVALAETERVAGDMVAGALADAGFTVAALVAAGGEVVVSGRRG